MTNSSTSPYAVVFATFQLLDNHGNEAVPDGSVTITSISGADSQDLAPITAFELDIVGPINGEIATLSSGAGCIYYTSFKPPLKVYVSTAANPEPTCTEIITGTCETANTFYGLLPANSNVAFKQSFEMSRRRP